MAKIRLRAKQFTCLFLMLTSVLLGFSFLPRAGAQMHVFSVSPTSGNVGTNVTVTANLTTTNGAYNVTFNGAVLAVGTAVGNSVTAWFLVPAAVAGNYNVTVIDLSTLENANSSFTVTTAYFLNVTVPTAPLQFQEGNSVSLTYNVTGDNATATEGVQIEVLDPGNSTYSDLAVPPITLKPSDLGSGSVTVSYPGSFPSGANTNLVGIYTVSTVSNSSVSPIAFTVGLTNSTEYHRMETVNVMATGYDSGEPLTMNITGTNVQYSVNLTANSSGAINFSGFVVPTNATVGTYTVNIVSTAVPYPTLKAVPDTQDFTVPGFAFNATAVNLAGDVVPGATIDTFENVSDVSTSVANQTTDSNGLAVLMLEIGSYSWEGYYQNDVLVGEGTFDVNNTVATNLLLNLTDLGVRVVAFVNGNEVGIPEAGVSLTPASGTAVTLTTDINGNAEEQSLLPNGNYTLTGSRYGTAFNVTNIINSTFPDDTGFNGTLNTLLGVNGTLQTVFNVTIACPSFAFQIQAYEADGQPFSGATVEASELVGGINYENNTDSSGLAVFNATFGEYYVQVFDSAGTLLNSTMVDLFQDQNVTVSCDLFGLSISVTVTDYFGQPFANTKVTLQGTGVGPISSQTQANGTVTFSNLIGESYNVSVYLSNNGSPNAIENLLVSGSTAASIRLNRYVLLAGHPVETTQLAVVLVIVLSVVFVLVLEVLRRRRVKGQKQTVKPE